MKILLAWVVTAVFTLLAIAGLTIQFLTLKEQQETNKQLKEIKEIVKDKIHEEYIIKEIDKQLKKQ